MKRFILLITLMPFILQAKVYKSGSNVELQKNLVVCKTAQAMHSLMPALIAYNTDSSRENEQYFTKMYQANDDCLAVQKNTKGLVLEDCYNEDDVCTVGVIIKGNKYRVYTINRFIDYKKAH